MKLTKLYLEFFNSEKAGGLILLIATALSLMLANTHLGSDYAAVWKTEIGGHSIVHWINDGLMAVFFLLIGLELEREIYRGELSGVRNALLPLFAAVGGMLIPAGIYILFNYGSPSLSGAGIPMATDIAFALGILSVLGKRVPSSLKIFLTALAVIDDLGSILVIAIFYTSSLAFTDLFIALGLFCLLLVLNKLRVNNLIPYLLGGLCIWYFLSLSGVHPAITGILLAFAIPFGDGKEKSPSYRLQHFLHKPVAFLILPLFALANTCIPLAAEWQHNLFGTMSLGIILGLVAGKPLGILLFSFLSVKAGITSLPQGLTWRNLAGAGMLGGIGFTMSIFIAFLAFSDPALIDSAKISILIASLLSAVAGLSFLTISRRKSDAE